MDKPIFRQKAHFMECYHCGYRVASDSKQAVEMHMIIHLKNSHDNLNWDFESDVIKGFMPIEDYEHRKALHEMGKKLPITIL